MTRGEVWLYGSSARGDTDALSDTDVLLVGEVTRTAPELRLLSRRPVSLVEYSWQEIENMAAYGSLFLHHVKLEGKRLTFGAPSRLAAILESLPTYGRAEQEIEAFERVVADVEKSIRADHSPAFELSVLATSLRHAAILGSYLLGTPTFGREAPFLLYERRFGPEGAARDFAQLYRFRMAGDGRGTVPFDATSEDVVASLEKVRIVLHNVRGLL